MPSCWHTADTAFRKELPQQPQSAVTKQGRLWRVGAHQKESQSCAGLGVASVVCLGHVVLVEFQGYLHDPGLRVAAPLEGSRQLQTKPVMSLVTKLNGPLPVILSNHVKALE